MSKKDVKLFFNEVKNNKQLKAKVDEANASVNEQLNREESIKFFKEKLFPLIKEYGFDFTYEELLEYKKELLPDGIEIDDELLAKVSGGTIS